LNSETRCCLKGKIECINKVKEIKQKKKKKKKKKKKIPRTIAEV